MSGTVLRVLTDMAVVVGVAAVLGYAVVRYVRAVWREFWQ